QKFDEFGPPAPMLRKSFNIEKKVKSAVAFVTGLGYFELYLNGEKAGPDVMVPNVTNYGKRPLLGQMLINVEDNFKEYKVMYLAYDVTSMLSEGENVVGTILGNGFYNPRMFWCEGYGTTRFLGQLHITYTDGSEEVVVSDESWKAAKSPILKNMVFYGETYDARLEQPGWCKPGFDAGSWENAVIRKAPFGKPVAHTSPTDKVMEQLQPVKIEKLENGNYFVDFGKEISGWVRLNNVSAPAGHQIDISFNSNLYSGDNTYIFKGEGPENYAPRFNWFVFSGVEIKNWCSTKLTISGNAARKITCTAGWPAIVRTASVTVTPATDRWLVLRFYTISMQKLFTKSGLPICSKLKTPKPVMCQTEHPGNRVAAAELPGALQFALCRGNFICTQVPKTCFLIIMKG
ncbi:MAG: hypothetical protein FD181_3771, partial [Prolixibacteraceae bacterium]